MEIGKMTGGAILFKKVKTEEELTLFNNIWMENWSKMGFETEPFKGLAKRYIVHNEYQQPAATVELIPYNPDHNALKETSTIEDLFRFSEIEKIQTSKHQCYEIDKVSILEKYKGQRVLDNILNLLFHFAEENEIKYYLAVTEPLFFRTLKHYKVPIIKLGNIIHHKGYKVIPSLIDAENGVQNREKFDWFANHHTQLKKELKLHGSYPKS
jgi:hypothetical protein